MVFYIHRLSPLGVLLPAALELHFLSWRGLICVYTWVSTRVKNDNWDDGGGEGGDAEAGDDESDAEAGDDESDAEDGDDESDGAEAGDAGDADAEAGDAEAGDADAEAGDAEAEAGDAEDADDGGGSFRKDKCSSVPCSVLHCLRSSPSVCVFAVKIDQPVWPVSLLVTHMHTRTHKQMSSPHFIHVRTQQLE